MSPFQQQLVTGVVTIVALILGLLGLHVDKAVLIPWGLFIASVAILIVRQWKDDHHFFEQATAWTVIITGFVQAALDILHYAAGWLTPDVMTALATILGVIGMVIAHVLAQRSHPPVASPAFKATPDANPAKPAVP